MKKRIYFLVIFNILFTAIYASDIPVRNIKDSLLLFLKQTKDIPGNYTIDYIPNTILTEVKDRSHIENGKTGIFYIPSFSAHGYIHYLLIDKKRFQIINMREPFNANLEKLITYLKNNEHYNKSDILFYISDFIKTYEKNKKKSKQAGIYIGID
ncbi:MULTISPECIES: hypothetical protein [Dysgonomonas]|uniref:Uncharacterized protein n=1 Tax=Dysgonomonas gadei ATCC BAA-286 TaxID=742766 RepID=F5J3Z0_9BACT|nr:MULTISPECIES: hypothetical protein [Dysgonomonas]EGJ99561.1 hypothetical protein HMPREF9455_04057 [Dysgonomonas gadei ATCC BAA-286]MBF0650910.1 hypothetical protein [Dysgonomonas sp. GY75]